MSKLTDKLMEWLCDETPYPEEPSNFTVVVRLKCGREERKTFASRQKADGTSYPATEQLADYFRSWKKQAISWEDGKLARYSEFESMRVE